MQVLRATRQCSACMHVVHKSTSWVHCTAAVLQRLHYATAFVLSSVWHVRPIPAQLQHIPLPPSIPDAQCVTTAVHNHPMNFHPPQGQPVVHLQRTDARDGVGAARTDAALLCIILLPHTFFTPWHHGPPAAAVICPRPDACLRCPGQLALCCCFVFAAAACGIVCMAWQLKRPGCGHAH